MWFRYCTRMAIRLASLAALGGFIALPLALTGLAQEVPKLTRPALNFCRAPRSLMCMEIYAPVCGFAADGSRHTYDNACVACNHITVVRYTPGKCKA